MENSKDKRARLPANYTQISMATSLASRAGPIFFTFTPCEGPNDCFTSLFSKKKMQKECGLFH
jgi:hypothetical protein